HGRSGSFCRRESRLERRKSAFLRFVLGKGRYPEIAYLVTFALLVAGAWGGIFPEHHASMVVVRCARLARSGWCDGDSVVGITQGARSLVNLQRFAFFGLILWFFYSLFKEHFTQKQVLREALVLTSLVACVGLDWGDLEGGSVRALWLSPDRSVPSRRSLDALYRLLGESCLRIERSLHGRQSES